MHGHLQSAKNALVSAMESNEGNYAHSINGVASKPEGFVNNYTHNGVTEPTKFVNRAEFARQNLLKSRGEPKPKSDVSENHVMAYGRMNPPTAGHEKLVNKIHDEADARKASHELILSASHQTKDGSNPLPPNVKLKFAQQAFPKTNIKVADKARPTVLHHASHAYEQGAKKLVLIGGEDRKPMHELLQKYNGQKGAHGFYNFDKIEFANAGARDPKAKGTEGISGTKLRGHAAAGEQKEFESHLSSQMKPEHKTELYHALRQHMGVK
jgi:hypothetical protein